MSDPQQITILNVDDDETARYTTSHVLHRAGFAVLEAATGSAALDLARAAPLHLIILDVNLPDMSGFEVCRRLKADPATAAIPVLHLSATFTKSTDRTEGLENGADAYLVQPVEAAELLATVRSLLRLRRTEEALRRSEMLAQRLLQTVPDAIVVGDGEGRIVLVNAPTERMFGYSQEELLGALVEVLLPERCRGLHVAHRATYMAIPHPRAMGVGLDLWGRRKDGSEFPVDVSLSPLETPDGLLVVSFIRDITGRQHLEAQLRQMQKMEAIGTLAGGIAHDFNNILSVIMVYTELMLRDAPHESPAWARLQHVLTACDRAKHLVQQILTFSRQSEQEHQPIQLHLLVKEALQLLRATLPTTIEIRQVIDDVGTILADPTQMYQLLMNLCTNAEHAMRERGGRLEVGLETVAVDAALAALHPALLPVSYIRLRVRDTGHGMPPALLARIFEPFFTTKGVGEGTGMGLAMVHGIVTSHGGAITVESTPGEGTGFAVYLPRMANQARADTPLEEPVQGGQECILFVDDEAMLALLGQEMLAPLGYQVVVHTNSVEALEAFRTAPQRYDLVITDQTMPDLTGEALARELRHLRPDIPIILCTGFSHTMTQEKAHLLGINAFLMKPLMIRDLARTIREVLGQRSTHAPA